MTMRRLIPTLALTVAVGAALSGCLSNPGADPPPTIATASGYTPTTTPSPTTTDPATKERLDRQNAEDIWHQFNALLFTIESLPADQVEHGDRRGRRRPDSQLRSRPRTPSSGRRTRPASGQSSPRSPGRSRSTARTPRCSWTARTARRPGSWTPRPVGGWSSARRTPPSGGRWCAPPLGGGCRLANCCRGRRARPPPDPAGVNRTSCCSTSRNPHQPPSSRRLQPRAGLPVAGRRHSRRGAAPSGLV